MRFMSVCLLAFSCCCLWGCGLRGPLYMPGTTPVRHDSVWSREVSQDSGQIRSGDEVREQDQFPAGRELSPDGTAPGTGTGDASSTGAAPGAEAAPGDRDGAP